MRNGLSALSKILFLLCLALSLRASGAADERCRGRRVYAQKLPSRFNVDLLAEERTRDSRGAGDAAGPAASRASGDAGLGAGFGRRIRGVAVAPKLGDVWFQTGQTALESIFHARMLSYDCRVEDHGEADLIYVPYFGGHDLLRNRHKDLHSRDRLAMQLVAWLRAHPAWRARNGSDHFLVLGRPVWDFLRSGDAKAGSKLLTLEGVKENMWAVVPETSAEFGRIASTPRPVALHPQKHDQVKAWQDLVRGQKRRWLFSFAGGHRHGGSAAGALREALFWQCGMEKRCKAVDCDQQKEGKWGTCEDLETFFRLYLSSTFCLHPSGDSCTRRSVLDGILAGCIPVVFNTCTLEEQYQWHLDRKNGSIFVQINPEWVRGPGDAPNDTVNYEMTNKVMLADILGRIPDTEVKAMRRRVIDAIPSLIYGGVPVEDRLLPPDFKDAVDHIIDGLAKNIKSKRGVQ